MGFDVLEAGGFKIGKHVSLLVDTDASRSYCNVVWSLVMGLRAWIGLEVFVKSIMDGWAVSPSTL